MEVERLNSMNFFGVVLVLVVFGMFVEIFILKKSHKEIWSYLKGVFSTSKLSRWLSIGAILLSLISVALSYDYYMIARGWIPVVLYPLVGISLLGYGAFLFVSPIKKSDYITYEEEQEIQAKKQKIATYTVVLSLLTFSMAIFYIKYSINIVWHTNPKDENNDYAYLFYRGKSYFSIKHPVIIVTDKNFKIFRIEFQDDKSRYLKCGYGKCEEIKKDTAN